ncbi:hypothetical protein QGP82_12780 [Leptothoe sp. LEGE 181152]|nr:hypothetical protein [Leptothoe sp. LEGE 181152]
MRQQYWVFISAVMAVIAAIVISTSLSNAVPIASFVGIGDLPGGWFKSYALAISADGSVIVGASHSSTELNRASLPEAFRWTRAEGMVGLGQLPGNPYGTVASDISADGSVIAGHSDNEAFRWTQATGLVGLGDLPDGSFRSRADAISADGSVIVGKGSSEANYHEAFRWTQAEGMRVLGSPVDLPIRGSFTSRAVAVSADGSVIVGFINPNGHNPLGVSENQAFRWTQTGGMSLLSDPTDKALSMASDVSADGSVVVGKRTTAFETEIFRWTQAEGMVSLGEWPGSVKVSADGAIVLGGSFTESTIDAGAFIWDAVNGMRSLQAVFTDEFGLDLTGWKLGAATGISDDGLTIVGTGINPEGHLEGWIADLHGAS